MKLLASLSSSLVLLAPTSFAHRSAPQEPIDPMTVCFAPGTDAEYMNWYRSTLYPQPEFVGGTRWTGSQGDPIALTWSIVPDGLLIPSSGSSDPAGNSEVFARLDALFAAQGGRATWIAQLQSSFDRWEALTGIDFTRVNAAGVDWDDGAAWGSDASATRGHIRISMRNIDGASKVLARAFYPNNGDVVMDRAESWANAADDFRFLRNAMTHEVGHSVGLQHVCSSDSNQLMAPLLDTSIDGPRQDDIRASQRLYGDDFEPDNTAAAAKGVQLTMGVPTTLGTPPAPPAGANDTHSSTLSLDANGESDYFKFTVASPASLDVTLTPIGSSYFDNAEPPPPAACPVGGTSTNALAQADLVLGVIGINGTTVLALADSTSAGGAETLTDVFLSAPGTYFVRVTENGAPTQPQLYQLTLRYDVPLSSYCTAGTSTNGCTPSISASVAPNSANSAGCVITTTGVEGQKLGFFFYGVDNTGFTPTPWAPGSTSLLCVKPPTTRLGSSLNSGGVAGQCNGTFVVDWDAFQIANPTALGNPWVVGDKVFVQSWYRDPLAVKASNLSNALELTLRNAPPVSCVTTIPGMVVIPAGTFQMGSNAAGGAPYFNGSAQQPVHQVTLSYCFWMGATEVTQAQYSSLMGSNPSFFVGANNPVERVSWFNAQAYCAALTAQQAALGNVPAGYQYRLPTEAEWEYACRAGTTTEFNVGASLFCNQARFGYSHHSNLSCSSGSHVPVASYAPNAWGLHDMNGNVWEWCLDSYAAYSAGAVTDPFVTGGPYRVFRGGSWYLSSNSCRSAQRELHGPPDYTSLYHGFRVVLAPVLVP